MEVEMAYGIDRAMGNIKKDIFLKKTNRNRQKSIGNRARNG